MIYSVWNQGVGKYDYYQDAKVQAVANAPIPKHLASAGSSSFGLAPDHASWPLPSSAVKTGSGEHPRGRVAHQNGGKTGLGDFDVAGIPASWLVFVGLAAYLWHRNRR